MRCWSAPRRPSIGVTMLLGFPAAVKSSLRGPNDESSHDRAAPTIGFSHGLSCKSDSGEDQAVPMIASVMRVFSISMTADMSRRSAATQAGSKKLPLCART